MCKSFSEVQQRVQFDMPTMEKRSFPANTFIPHSVNLHNIFKTENEWLLCSFVVESDCGVNNAQSDVAIY